MKSDHLIKHAAIGFAIALVLYISSWSWIEHRRNRLGPWEVEYTTTNGVPVLIIHQRALGIRNVQLQFPGEELPSAATNLPLRVEYKQTRPWPFDVPFGRCIFQDLTFQPGTLTLDLFGHEVELIPRVIIVDHREHPWRNDETHSLSLTNKPARIGREKR